MPTTLRLVCPFCRAHFALPESERAEIEGKAACCAAPLKNGDVIGCGGVAFRFVARVQK